MTRLEIHKAGIIPAGRSSGTHAYSKSPIDDNQLSAWRSGRFSLKERSFLTGICSIKSNSSRPAHTLMTELPQTSNKQITVSTCRLRRWRKEQKAHAGYEAGTCFMALDVSQKYTSAARTFAAGSHYNVSDTCFCTDSNRWVIHPRQANIYPFISPHSLNTSKVSIYQNHSVVLQLTVQVPEPQSTSFLVLDVHH